MTTKQALSVVDTLRIGWYDPPYNYHIKKESFLLKSYSRSAMDEIKFYLMEHEKNDPIASIENFRNMMNEFACKEIGGFMFSTYYDVATDILDVLLSMSVKREEK